MTMKQALRCKEWKELSLKLKIRQVSCYVFIVLLNRVTAWNINEATLKVVIPLSYEYTEKILRI